jgi:hypothetical protein
MSPLKYSLFGKDDDREDSVELDDDELLGQLRDVVDATPDLTMEQALREGVQHVVERHGRSSAG